MPYFLGVDIGTTAVKSVAFSVTGTVLQVACIEYGMYHPLKDHSEQDPGEIFSAVISSIKNITTSLNGRPAFISFSAAMHSIMAVDKAGKPLTQLIIWADNRAKAIAEKLKDTEAGKRCYKLGGVPVHAMSPLCKLLWLKENEPGIFKDAYKFIGIKEYVFYRLFNRYITDSSIASATGLLNTELLAWEPYMLSLVGITENKLSAVVPATASYTLDTKDEVLDFLNGVVFVAGASDGACANIGTRSAGSIMAVTIGTSGAARIMVSAPHTDEAMRTFCYHVSGSRYIIGGGNNNGAIVLQWLKEQLLETSDSYELLFEKAAAIPAGCDGLLMLPYLLGERAPLWNASAKAMLFGITKAHTKAHLVRATLEAVIFSMFSIARVMMETNTVTAVHASGGFAKSPLWLQVLADVFGVEVQVSGAYEAAAMGAVMLGAEASGMELSFEDAVTAAYRPDKINHEVYAAAFAKFQRLYALVNAEMN